MWFGDLATMRWWDDLWLNESFATYVSNLALAEATRFDGAWRGLPRRHEALGLPGGRALARPTRSRAWSRTPTPPSTTSTGSPTARAPRSSSSSSPRSAPTRSGPACGPTSAATPGATPPSPTSWRRSRTGAGRPLRDWSRRWLETASLNTIEAAWTARDGRVERLQLTQEAPEDHPTLRPHALELALVRAAGDGPAEVDVVPARLEGAEAWVEAAAGRPAPDLVFPNHGDHGYARVLLDPASLAAVPRVLARIDDPLLRQLALGHPLGDGAERPLLVAGLPGAGPRRSCPRSVTTRSCWPALDAARAALARYVPEERRLDEARRFVAAALETLDGLPAGRPADALAAGGDRRRRGARRRGRRWPRVVDAGARPARWCRWTARCAGASPPSPSPTACPERRSASPPSAPRTRRTGASARCCAPRPGRPTRPSRPRPGSGSTARATGRSTSPRRRCAASTTPTRRPSWRRTWTASSTRCRPWPPSATTPSCGRTSRPSSRPTVRSRRSWSAPGRWPTSTGAELPSLRRLLLEAADDMERAVVCRSFASLRARGHA